MSKTWRFGRYQFHLELQLELQKRAGRPKKGFLYRLKYFFLRLLRVATDNRFTGNRLSRVLRRVFEQHFSQRLLGINLLAATVFVGLLPTSSPNLLDNLTNPHLNARLLALTTRKTIALPLANLEISQNYTFFHPGLDLRTPLNAPVKPIMAGTVKLTSNDSVGYGRHVLVDHGNGFESLYAHLNQIKIKEGDFVTHETILGLSGSTGHSSGPHLHLEVHDTGVPVNPLILLK
jgi:murein DD-endopeptidase MepM/ murein hydrolase activator NlpD